MKTRNPISRRDLNIKRKDLVLEVGGGHNPHSRSNIVVDKHIDSNYHRSGDIFVNKNQVFKQADGENLPFEDKEFDYVICNQVLEHVENPESFLNELSRVGKAGFIETPSLIGEYLFPKESHSWVILELDNKLVLVKKEKINMNSSINFGELFLHYLPKHSIGYKILEKTYPDLMTVRYEWKDNIDFIIHPTDQDLTKYFEKPWDIELINSFFKKRNVPSEIFSSIRASLSIIRSYVVSYSKKVLPSISTS